MSDSTREQRTDLIDRMDALEAAADAGAGRLSRDLIKRARAVLKRATKRRGLSRVHTVVALAGATGGGKSTLFNSISGMTISPVGVRRPTTAYPMACVWGTLGVAPLLDWLGVPRRHQIARESVLDSGVQDELDGLVLLDLPDHDSTADEHRATAERLMELVDVFVWVVDPEKYADAALHDRYLRPLAAHRTVTAVVLNQVDRLAPGDVKRCVDDLHEILDRDGLTGVPILAMSALTGEGVDQFTDLLRNAVSKQRAHDDRVAADVRSIAEDLRTAGGDGPPAAIDGDKRTQLVAALSEAVAADVVASAVGRTYLTRARQATGWPLTRWLGKLRRDPLKSVGLGKTAAPELHGTSAPEVTPVQPAQSDAAIRLYGTAVAELVPVPWRGSIRQTARRAAAGLPAALDRAVAATDLGVSKNPRWWSLFRVGQWLGLTAALGGGLWLAARGVGSILEFDVPYREVGGIPVAVVLLAGGVLFGVLIAAAAAALARSRSAKASAAARQRLNGAVEVTAGEVVIKPLEAELDRYRAFCRSVEVAAAK